MAQWVDIPLATQIGVDAPAATGENASYVSMAELVNLMVVPNPPGTRKPFHLAHVPGLSSASITTPGSGVVRGLCYHVDSARLFVIRGTAIYYAELANLTSWTLVPVGTMPGTAMCRMVDASTHVVAVDGTNARAITAAESFACSRGNFSDVTYQDGFTVYTETATDSVYSSSIDDPTTIDALHFTTADALPGDVVAIVENHRELFVFKSSCIEYYQNVGKSGFPFARSSPGVIERGVYSGSSGATSASWGRATVCKYGNTVFWLGDDLRVYMMQGYQPTPISTPWVERLLTEKLLGVNYVYPSASAFVLDGALYYAIGSTTHDYLGVGALTTLVCDVGRGVWHKRHSPLNTYAGVAWTHAVQLPALGGAQVAGSSHGQSPVVVAGLHGTALTSSTLYRLEPTSYNDTGAITETPRCMTLPQYAPGGDLRTSMPELRVDMQKAAAAATMTVEWSDDGGTTFTTAKSATANVPRPRWLRLGSFFQRILRFRFEIASKLAIMGVRARIEVGE